jgi:ureidoacrylate peracid hydrolase
VEVLKDLKDLVKPSHTALLVVDPQHVFCSAESEFVRRQGIDTSRVEETVPRLNRFIRACRQQGTMVVYTRQVLTEATMLPSLRLYALDQQDRIWFCGENTKDVDWYEKAEPPLDGEPVITKHSFDAFQDTNLQLLLQNRGIRTLLVTGFTSNVCVESTARHGFFNGYYIVLVADCVNAYNRAEHESTLFNIGKYFGRAVSSQEVLAAWARGPAPA